MTPAGRRRVSARQIIGAAGAIFLLAVFLALGTWQVERRAWKLDLIERVQQRVRAPAVAAPAPDRWAQVSRAADEYRHVRVTGTFLHDKETLVQAVTALGGGFWVLTPLQLPDGHAVLVNRGFVPAQARDRASRGTPDPAGPATVTGLLRLTEPGGAFLHKNDPSGNRWYSRDVQAIAASHGLQGVAPFFIDADADPAAPAQADGGASPPRWPAAGLTVVNFPNNHLVYAITWYALALMVAAGAWYVVREERRMGRRQIGENGE